MWTNTFWSADILQWQQGRHVYCTVPDETKKERVARWFFQWETQFEKQVWSLSIPRLLTRPARTHTDTFMIFSSVTNASAPPRWPWRQWNQVWWCGLNATQHLSRVAHAQYQWNTLSIPKQIDVHTVARHKYELDAARLVFSVWGV